MRIGGMVPFSLCDFPGRPAAVVFAQGCNLRCPFCHNGSLIPLDPPAGHLLPESDVLAFLGARRGQLEGVVVSGGEPTIQSEVLAFVRDAKALGYTVKLDTNGTRPDAVSLLIRSGFVDFVAMDIKAPIRAYDRLTGVRAPVDAVKESVNIIARSGLPHEFRTTMVMALLSSEDVTAIREMVPAGSSHRLQGFQPEHALCPMLRKKGD